MSNQFTRSERLKSRKLIQEVFKSGESFFSHPVKAVYLEFSDAARPALIVGFTVPKRNFKKASDRNRIKRLMRESFRLSKKSIVKNLSSNQRQFAIMFIYIGKETSVYKDLEKAVFKILKKLSKKVSN